ncbi:MAG: hypothetical protein AB1439_08940 [candidate division FCPU426 bacterium]
MKKTLMCSLILAASLGMGAMAAAAPVISVAWPIGIAVAYGEIDLVAITNSMHFGWVAPGSAVFSNQPQGLPRCTISNHGYAVVDYTVSATITSAGGPAWILGPTLGSAGYDTCVIAAIFTKPLDTASDFTGGYSRDLVLADFGDNDVLSGMPLVAGTDVLARDNSNVDPDDPENVKGYNVQPVPGMTERSLRFMVLTPTIVSSSDEQFFNVVIGAQVH